MPETIEALFDKGLERYNAKEDPSTLIPVFKELCDRAPKTAAAWTCLAWLYLLEDKFSLAYKAAQKAVKLNPQDAQARVNLAVAMLGNRQTGVRQHVDLALQLIMVDSEMRDEIQQNIADGLSRKPNWKELERVRKWLFDVEE